MMSDESPNGVLLVDKGEDMTSHDVVEAVERGSAASSGTTARNRLRPASLP